MGRPFRLRQPRTRSTLSLVVVFVAAVLFLPTSAIAHEPGFSSVQVVIEQDQVAIELFLPVDQLAEATGLPLVDEVSVAANEAEVIDYLGQNIGIESATGEGWDEEIFDIGFASEAEEDVLQASLTFTPPSGVITDFDLVYSVIIESDDEHEALVGVRNNAAGSLAGATIGAQEQVLTISADGESVEARAAAFVDIVILGFEHVVEGADHILFLVVLILPAPLLINEKRRWGSEASPARMLKHILAVSFAFMIGHSFTLALATFEWVSAPAGPVEVLIAASIGFGAIHAIVPIVRRGDVLIAAGFGLVHGLAFAEILDSLALGGTSAIVTLLAFNVGVELAQLASIAVFFPALYLLTRSSHYGKVRVGVASLSLIAAIGWIGDRVGAFSNPLGGIEDWAIHNPFVVIGVVTVFAGVMAALSSDDKSHRRGVFPGSFNPLTVAHLALAEQARADYDLDSIDLVLSEVALDKPAPPGPSLSERVELVEKDIAEHDWLTVRTTPHQLIVDIAEGYDAVVMGADKWAQVNDVSYYGSDAERDSAIARLPQLIVADRSGFIVPGEVRMATDEALHSVSSTEARAGDRSIMAPHASKDYPL